MNYEELNEGQKHQLAESYMIQLVNEGRYAEFMGVEWDAPSYGEMAAALELVPESVLREEYGDTVFSEDDFFN